MVAVRAVTRNGAGTGTALTGNKPTGTADGDQLIAYVLWSSSSATLTAAPTGWTLQEADPNPADFSLAMYSKIASSEGASWEWTASVSVAWNVIVVAVQAPHVTTPVNVDLAEILATGDAIAVGPMTTTISGCLVLTLAVMDATGAERVVSADGTPTQHYGNTGNSVLNELHVGLFSEIQAAAGAITRTASQDTALSDQAWGSFMVAIAPVATAAITGTATASISETDIVSGGKTVIITLTGDAWVAAGASFDAQRQNIINGMDSAQSELLGWDNTVKALQGVAGVVRTSDTVATITLDAQATYNITATETITVTVPATALVGAGAVVGSPTFTVTATGGAATTKRNNLTLTGVS